jgi:formate hydrogenlyase subunit 4
MALTFEILAVLVQAIVALGLAPLVVGIARMVAARVQRRAGPPVWQLYCDIWKLLNKDVVLAHDASWLSRTAPYAVFALIYVAAVLTPTFTSALVVFRFADIIGIVALLAAARFVLALAAMDAGGFGGVGASRGMMVSSLTEPAMLLVVFAVAMIAGSTQLSAIAATFAAGPGLRISLGLALFAFVCVALAENGRIPADGRAMRPEFAMSQDAMALEFSGRHLALFELAAALKLTLYISLLACLFVPYGMATTGNTGAALALGLFCYVAKLAVIAALLPLGEAAVAKLRLFAVPGFLGGALTAAALAVLFLFASRGM